MALGQIHRVVGQAEQDLGVAGIFGVEVDPDADGHLHLVSLEVNGSATLCKNLVRKQLRILTTAERLEE